MNPKTVLVTGAAGSLGSALSRLCLEEGFNTVMLDVDRRGLEAFFDRAGEAKLLEPVLHPLDLSVAGTEDFEQLTEAIEAEFGGLDALVHCAARFGGLTPLEHLEPNEWLMHMQVNLNAAWLLSVHCLPMLRQSPSGCLYFMVEDLAVVGGPLWGAYGVSKHALCTMVGQFAAECEADGIQVLGINPGAFRSPLRSEAYIGENPAEQTPPETAARGIIDLLTGRQGVSDVFVTLSGSNGSNVD
jgi:NAD(P)-dependent dehydrogenase (short-subunit alcohol dehydrogenase family)